MAVYRGWHKKPVIRNRNFALRAAAHWGFAAWPPEGRAIIERACAEEPHSDVYLKFADVLEGRPFTDGVVHRTQHRH